MIMTFIMMIIWQTQGEQYRPALMTCGEAYYQGSDVKQYADAAVDIAKKEFPVLASSAPIAYAVGVKRQVKLTSRRISLIPDTITTYAYDHNAKAGSISIAWSF